MSTDFVLDSALRSLTARVVQLELKDARLKPASGITFTDDGGFFGGGFPNIQDILDAIGAGTLPTGFLKTKGGGVGETFDLGSMGSAALVDLANANDFYGELDADCNVTTTGWTNLKGCWVTLELTEDGTGDWTPTVAGVTWATDPPTSAAAGEVIFILLYSRDGGTTIWGWVTGGNATASEGMVPYLIPTGQTFTVPINKQALKAMPITVDGTLVVDGYLLEVA
jgi:hypothetical protein